MRRGILILLLFSVLVNAALDQSYVHTVSRDGSSTITKGMDPAIFSNILSERDFEKVSEVCQTGQGIECSVGAEELTITEGFSSGAYYTLTTDHGIPFITYELVVRKVPTDRFASSLDEILVAAEVAEAAGGSVRPLDLRDREVNEENAYYLEKFNVDMTYTINMPVPVREAYAGDVGGVVSGSSVEFDLVEVLKESDYITVTSRELNFGYLTVIAMAIVLAALALSFFRGKKPRKRKKK